MINIKNNRIEKRYDDELLIIEPWGENSLRVRTFLDQHFVDRENALTEKIDNKYLVKLSYEDDVATLINGNIKVTLDHRDRLTFYNE